MPSGSIKLQGQKTALYRIRSGDYRVVYFIKKDVLIVLVVEIGHRREVYR
jgi:mRNA interferase RelE/StbE